MGKGYTSAFLVLKPCSLVGLCRCSSQIRNITEKKNYSAINQKITTYSLKQVVLGRLILPTVRIIKLTGCINFSNLFWNENLRVSDSSSVNHQEFFTVHTQMVYVIQLASRIRTFHPDPARKLSANLFDIHHCCVYSEKHLMMNRGTVRNM